MCFVGVYLCTSVIFTWVDTSPWLQSINYDGSWVWDSTPPGIMHGQESDISQEKWVGSESAYFIQLSIVFLFFECYFNLLLCLLHVKIQNVFRGFAPWTSKSALPRICWGRVNSTPSSRSPAAFRATLVFQAHIIWASLALQMSTFFSVLTSASSCYSSSHNHLLPPYVVESGK